MKQLDGIDKEEHMLYRVIACRSSNRLRFYETMTYLEKWLLLRRQQSNFFCPDTQIDIVVVYCNKEHPLFKS
jgi:hypothetical protein